MFHCLYLYHQHLQLNLPYLWVVGDKKHNYNNLTRDELIDEFKKSDKPVILRESIKPFTTTREELLFEESNKILFHKGFIFNLYQTDRERLNTYINEKEKEKDYENKMISYESKNNNDNITTKITQPQMRFKPRTDLERIYHILSNYRPSKVGKKSKKIIENQLNDLLKIKLKKITNKSENMIFHDASTIKGSSGSPIIRRGKDNYVIGLHRGQGKRGLSNIGTPLNAIINNIKEQLNEINCTYILNQYENEIYLLHDYNLEINEILEDKNLYSEAKKLNKTFLENNVEIYINNEKINFRYKYKMNNLKEIKVKFKFNICSVIVLH